MRGHKKQLHERILKRQSQLQAELEEVASPNGASRSSREIALADALASLEMHLTNKWDAVGELEAGELSRWLESTRFLVDESRSSDRADAIWRRLESQWKLDQYGVPTQE